jgi:hypothetical protein
VPTVLAHEQKQASSFLQLTSFIRPIPWGHSRALNVCAFPAYVFPERLNMNAKTIAHSIQVALHTATSLDLKRSHVHELIAAAFGCGSYAAMLSRGVLCPMPRALAQRQRLEGLAISRRACGLGYPLAVAGEVGHFVLAAIEQDSLRLLSLDLVLRLLLDGQTELRGWDFAPEEEGFDARVPAKDADVLDDNEDLDEEAWYARQREEEAAVMDLACEEVISAVTSAIERADGRAHLAMALLLVGDLDELHPSNSSDGRYWHDREQMGHVLNGVEREWAEDYRQRIDAQQRAKAHLTAAADLRQPDALLFMAQRYADPRFFELERPKVYADPVLVARLADNMGHPEAAVAWLESAAERGDMGAMRELIQEKQSTDPLKCWTWFHLAKLHGNDLTRDDYHAINEDGSPYDDDVGGPVFADGEDGVELPEADEAIRQLAEARAFKIFSR